MFEESQRVANLRFQIRGEADRARATAIRRLNHLPNRFHDVCDDRIVQIDAV
jgi:hypothetical protein